MRKIRECLADEKGFTIVEGLVATSIIAMIALTALLLLKPYINNSASTLGGKVQNAVGSNNPSW